MMPHRDKVHTFQMLPESDSARLGQFQLRWLGPEAASSVMALRERVLGGLEHPDIYVREPDELAFVQMHLGVQSHWAGETLGVFDGDNLIAYAMLGLPHPESPDNLGRWLAGAQAVTAHIASCMVLPEYRGHGLQRVLLTARCARAKSKGRSVCVCMVSLHNHASRRNLMREGLRIAWVGIIDGLQRQLLAVDMEQPWQFAQKNVRLVDILDYDRQRELTRRGWWGVSELEGAGQEALVFAKLKDAQDSQVGPW